MKKTKPRKGTAEAILPYAGIWADVPDETIERMHATIRHMRHGWKCTCEEHKEHAY